jgi:hypothetical protein
MQLAVLDFHPASAEIAVRSDIDRSVRELPAVSLLSRCLLRCWRLIRDRRLAGLGGW